METSYLMLMIFMGSTLFVGALVGITIFWIAKSQNRFIEKIHGALEGIAAEVNGTFYEAGDRARMFSSAFRKKEAQDYARLHPGGIYPALSFPFKGGEGMVYFNTSGGEDTMTYWTSVTLSLKRPFENSISLATEGMGDRLSKLLGARDVTVGDAAFDERFMIKGENEVFVRTTLNASVRKLIVQLAEVSNTSFELHIGGNIVIKSEGFIEEKEALRSYILLSIDLGNALI
jgi:hypothetical protein